MVISICDKLHDSKILANQPMNTTNSELKNMVGLHDKLRRIIRKNLTNNHQFKHRKRLALLAEKFDRRSRRTLVNRRSKITIEQMHEAALTECLCGAKPMSDIFYQVLTEIH